MNPTSNVQTLTLIPSPVVSVSGGGVVCTSGSATLTANVTNAGAVSFSYQWRKSTVGPTGPWTNVGTNSATYQTETLTATTYYQVELIGNFPSACIPVLSNTETVTVECCGFNNIIYVNASATGANNGTSWIDAFHYLQDALAIAECSNITQIWVVAGMYYPDDGGGQTAGDRAASFVMRNNLSILGGFPNAGTPGLGQRNWGSNPTILSGDIGTLNNPTDNSYHVIYNNFNAPNTGLNNTAVLDGFTITGGNGADYGGGMYNAFSSPSVTNCRFEDNAASISGGGMYNLFSSLTVSNCTFDNNAATSGGGMYNQYDTPTVSNCTFTNNSATAINQFEGGNGGGMYNASSSPAISGSTFNGNSASADPGSSHGHGGGMYNQQSSPTMTGCSFSSNTASKDGGGIYSVAGSTPTASNCTFTSNMAGNNGGGMVTYGASSATIDGCTFTSNTADNNGGGVFNSSLSSSPLTSVANCAFNNNSASNDGGGMYNLSSSPTVNGCTFTSNMATHDGGGMYNFNGSSPNIPGCIFTSNSADNDGGGMANSNSASPIVNSCTFDSNSAIKNGGGMYLYGGSSPDITGCTFTGNSVNLGGGGMYAIAGSNPAVLNCAFLGNSAAALPGTDGGNGGGMFNEVGSYMDFTNCIFLGNSASADPGSVGGYGGAFYTNTEGDIRNCNFSGNSASTNGGGLYRANQYTPNLVNCIFWGNSTEIGNGFQFTTPSISSSIVKGGCPTGFNCSNILDVNPLFVGQPPVGLGATGDLHLDSCSPAIDAGTASGAPSNDLEGNSRPANAGYDLGAYEFQGTVSTPLVCFLDGDNDGFGNAAMSMNFCGACGTGYVANSTDCDDMDAAINPGAVEVCGNNIDDNCNNQVDEGCCDLAITNSSSISETCPNAGDGGITVAATSSSGPITYSISGPASQSNNTGVFANLPAGTYNILVTDGNNCEATSSATVTAGVDNAPPVALCQNVTVYLDADGNAAVTVAQVDNGSYDNCGIQSMSVSPNTFTCANVGPNTVTLTVTDVNGLQSTCTATVTVADQVDPTAFCRNITVQLDATGHASIAAADVDNGSNDACGIRSLSVSPNSFTCVDVGANTVTLTVTDNNGNSHSASAMVTVEDNVAPNVLTNNITVQLDAAGSASITADVDAGSSDACGIASMTVSPSSFTCADVGANTVTLTVTDENGNSHSTPATVTVEDKVVPTVNTNNITVQLDAAGAASITAADVEAGSSDACGIASMTVSPSSFTCADVGANTVTLTVTDENGNSHSAPATVTVEDKVVPTVSTNNITVQLDAAGSASITGADVDAGSNDACGIASRTVSPGSFDCTNIGSNIVTLTVTDNNGNSHSAPATVTVKDNVTPAGSPR